MTREEAREILTHNWTRVDNPNYSESELDEAFFMAIEALQDRPTGEWIHDGVDVEGGVDWMHCSNCGKSDVWADATRTNFCPNCGARMKGGAE